MGNTLVSVGKEQVMVERRLGSGGFSQVYLARSQTTNKEYAMKVMYYSDQADLRRIKQEIQVHELLSKNEYVVPLAEFVDVSNSLLTHRSAVFAEPERKVVMLLDYCPVSTINVLERTYPNPIREEAVLKMFYQICHAVAFMHSQNPPLCHRDLKVENVLFKNKKFLLTDFGSVVPESKFYTRAKGDCPSIEENIQKYTTLAYRAPEMINLYDYQPIGRKADVWALGCVLFKICYFDTPFEESPMKIQFCKYSIPNKVYSSKVTQFFDKIFVPNPADRISVFQIMEILSKELNLPNPYADLVNQDDPVPNVVTPSPRPPESQPVVQSVKQPTPSSSAGLFWDSVTDVTVMKDDSVKAKGDGLFKQKVSGEKAAGTPSLNKSSDLFSFDEAKVKPSSSSSDLFSFDSTPVNVDKSPRVQTQSTASLLDFNTSTAKQQHVVMSKNSPTPTTQPSNANLFDFGDFQTSPVQSTTPARATPSASPSGDLFAMLDSNPRTPTPSASSGDSFWQSSDSFDFQGKW